MSFACKPQREGGHCGNQRLSRAGIESSESTMPDTSSNKPRHGAFMSGTHKMGDAQDRFRAPCNITLFCERARVYERCGFFSVSQILWGLGLLLDLEKRSAPRIISMPPPRKHTRPRSSCPAKGGRSSRARWPLACLHVFISDLVYR